MNKKIGIILTLGLVGFIISAGCIENKRTITIGGKPFNEQYILGEMIALLLEANGYQTTIKPTLNDLTLFEGIKQGQIDVYIEYTGTAYSQVLKLAPLDTWEPEAVYDTVVDALAQYNITVLCKIGFRDDYAIAVPKSWALENNVRTISELAPFAASMTFGSDLVFHERDDGLPRITEIYNFTFGEIRSMEPTLMYTAIEQGAVQAIPPYTTDTRVDLYNLQILIDNLAALPPYETMLLLREELLEDQKLIDTLSVLENLIDTETMRSLNAEFDIKGRDAKEIAQEFLITQGLLET